MAGFPITSLTLGKPAGVVDDETLLVAAIALAWLPRPDLSFATPGPCPGPVAVISPPAGWTTILADFPGGEDNLGVGVVPPGTGEECDRLAVFTRIVAAGDPASYTFDWAPGGASSAVGFIKAFNPGTPGISPTVDVAAPVVTISADVGNPLSVVAPSVTPVHVRTTLMCLYVARCVGFGATSFSIPVGMAAPVPDISGGFFAPGNLEVIDAAPIVLGVFLESRITNAATGTRTSTCDITTGYETAFQGMGYSLAIAGC